MLREVARVVRPGGWFVLDYLHAGQARRSLVPRDGRTVGTAGTAGTATVEQECSISPGGRFVRKTITMSELGRTFVERVRMYDPAELETLCTAARVAVASRVGDDDSSALQADSPRANPFAPRR